MMSDFFHKALTLLTGSSSSANMLRMPKNRPFKKLTERELLRQESAIGSQLFGPIPEGHRREFFCLDETTWIWHEEWTDRKGKVEEATTRYEVHANGILKVQEGAKYQYIEGEELDHLLVATRLYYEQVARGIYKRDPQSGVKLS
jgi:hypothetical protein